MGAGGVCVGGLHRKGVVRGHALICRYAKFQRNQTIRGRVIAIKLIKDGRRHLFWMFLIRTAYTLGAPLIGGGVCPKVEFETTLSPSVDILLLVPISTCPVGISQTSDGAQWPTGKAWLSISLTMGVVPTRKHIKRQNCISECESDNRFWIGKPGFLFELATI